MRLTKKYPVAFEADIISLERAYLEVVENSGAEILATLFGHFEKRLRVDEVGETEFLIVDKFDKIWPNIDCVRNLGIANLKNTFWVLRELNGKSTNENKVEKDIHFLIKTDNSVMGFGGCNSFSGNSHTINGTLQFSEIGTTHSMCKNSELENEYFRVLEKSKRYKIYGEYLYLYNDNTLLAKFESVYFN
ncbi:MAG: META domain-containing protein [Melioribacteraceae bacterium]|nr:META domain-containing protein [Melioribacteraceae bacterium]